MAKTRSRDYDERYNNSSSASAAAMGLIEKAVADTPVEAREEMAQYRGQNMPVDTIAKCFFPSIYRRSPAIAQRVVYNATNDYFTAKELDIIKRRNLSNAWEGRRKRASKAKK